MPPPVQYAKSGDLFIAYQVTGDGPVDLIWAPGATSHLALQWENPYFVRYSLARRQLVAYAGVEVDTAGDGLLARFDGPARAIRCARAIQREAKDLGLEFRAGVHTGEVELVGTAIRGIAVHTAARIASLAGGEVYTSNTVRDLVAGSGIGFQDRGVHTLKGIPDPRQVLTVAHT